MKDFLVLVGVLIWLNLFFNVLGMWWGWSNFFGSNFYQKLNIENKNEDSVR